MSAELRVVTDRDARRAVTDELVAELARVAGVIDDYHRRGNVRVGLTVLARLRELTAAAGITPTPPRRHR